VSRRPAPLHHVRPSCGDGGDEKKHAMAAGDCVRCGCNCCGRCAGGRHRFPHVGTTGDGPPTYTLITEGDVNDGAASIGR